MRALVVVSALVLAACGQGGLLGGGSTGWQLQEVRDELTGVATQTATRVAPMENGHIELTATCAGEQSFEDRSRYSHTDMDVLAAVLSEESGGPAPQAVEFRMTFIGASDDQSFSLASDGAALGLQSTIELRASTREGQQERLVGFVDHINSVTTQVPVAAFYGADAVSALRVEIPLLLQSATSGQPPLSQNVVVDLMPQDENLRTLLNACDPSVSQTTSSAPSAPAPAAPQPASLVLGSVPDDAIEFGTSCVALDERGVNVFMTDFTTAAIYSNGKTERLAFRGQDASQGGEFSDPSGRIGVRVALVGPMTEVQHELSSAPAILTVVVDGAETQVPVSYKCGS